jgi:hypothetical protein
MRIQLADYVSRIREEEEKEKEKKKVYKLLVGKPEGKKPLTRSKRRWKNDMDIELGERGWRGFNWTDLAQNKENLWAPLNVVMKLWDP